MIDSDIPNALPTLLDGNRHNMPITMPTNTPILTTVYSRFLHY